MSGPRFDCSRTDDMIDRVLDGAVRDEDKRHAVTCASCGSVLSRARRFDAELERTAHGLVVEDLPRRVLDPEIARQGGGSAGLFQRQQGLAGGAVAVAAIVLATALVLRPSTIPPGGSGTPEPLTQGTPITSPAPTPKPLAQPLHTTGELIVWLVGEMSFECVAGEALPTTGPDAGLAVRHSAVCTALDARRRYEMSYALGVSATGEIAGVTIRAGISGDDTPAARAAVAIGMAKLTALAFNRDMDSIEAYDFIFTKVPRLEVPTEALAVEVNSVQVSVERLAEGTYVVELSLPSSG